MNMNATNINQHANAVRQSARTHRGESAVQFHLRAWADELNQPESTDFHREDDSFNLNVLATLLTDESTIGPVYTALMPILELCTARLEADAVDDAQPDLDAAELLGAVNALRLFLDHRDTTVRETY